MPPYATEWRILDELADQPVATPTLRARLSQSQPVSSYGFYTCIGRLRSWGWLTGQRRSVTVYTITEQGLRALSIAQERQYEVTPMEVVRQFEGEEENDAEPSEQSDPLSLTFNDQSQDVLYLLECERDNLFITGRAGTGKSTLLQHFRATTEKRVVVVAPTGVAAVNVGGQTIHSFFRFHPGITLDEVRSRSGNQELYEELELLIIDEISMVRADLFDCIEKFLRLSGPFKGSRFGGVQIVLFGDLYQLPPVVPRDEARLFRTHYASPYFFDARSYPDADVTTVELTQVYRQRDADFVALLDAVRTGTLGETARTAFKETCTRERERPAETPIQLMTTNAMADRVNRTQLQCLDGKDEVYMGQIRGHFGERQLPTHETLHLRVGARVMLLNNDGFGRWVNGDLGEIVTLPQADEAEAPMTVRLDRGELIEVSRYTWEVVRFVYDGDRGRIESEVIGSFTQYPLRLAWAVTIHKAQGKTFDHVVVDFGRGTFAPGQAYVALSRCTTLAGLELRRPLESSHMWADERIATFMKSQGEAIS